MSEEFKVYSTLPVRLVVWRNGVRGVRIDSEVGHEYFVVVDGGIAPVDVKPVHETRQVLRLDLAITWASFGPNPMLQRSN